VSKNVFKSVEVSQIGKSLKLDRPATVVVNRVDDEQEKVRKLVKEQNLLVDENKLLVKKSQDEAETILTSAREEASRIIKEAEEQAFKHLQSAVDKAKVKEAEIFAQREKDIRVREEEARALMNKVQREVEDLRDEASKKGYKEGYNSGYEDGRTEMNRLIERLKIIIQAAIDKRREIIEESEEQIVRIILLMARKVVKHITAKDQEVVIQNIKASLDRVQGKEQIVIRVNSSDLEMTTEHKEEFIAMIEDLKYIKILEDGRVDRGGCIIETDFGSVDARIASQLEELEDKVRDVAHLTMFDPLINKKEAAVEQTDAPTASDTDASTRG
jgi:flagellar assembly protein FliH